MSHLLVRLKAPDKTLLVLETFERRRDIPPLVEFNANMQPALRNDEANTIKNNRLFDILTLFLKIICDVNTDCIDYCK